MTDWTRALHPGAPITDLTQARAVARLSAVAVLLGALYAAVGVVLLLTVDAQTIRDATAAAAAANPDLPVAASAISNIALVMACIMVAVQLIVAGVQWFRPNVFIPIIFALLTAYGLFTGVMGLVALNGGDWPAGVVRPAAWRVWSNIVLLIVQLALHGLAIRGASKLDSLKAV